MKKTCLALACLGFISSAYASNRIDFVNNTNFTISVNGNIAVGEINDCKGSCIKQIDTVEILPHSSRSVSLESRANDKYRAGGFGFSIWSQDAKGTESNVILPVSVHINGVSVRSVFSLSDCITHSFSAAEKTLPKYTVSIAQNTARNQAVANETVISINELGLSR